MFAKKQYHLIIILIPLIFILSFACQSSHNQNEEQLIGKWRLTDWGRFAVSENDTNVIRKRLVEDEDFQILVFRPNHQLTEIMEGQTTSGEWSLKNGIVHIEFPYRKTPETITRWLDAEDQKITVTYKQNDSILFVTHFSKIDSASKIK